MSDELEVLPEALDCELSVVDELVEGDDVFPLALVAPDALPEPEDWLVCAP